MKASASSGSVSLKYEILCNCYNPNNNLCSAINFVSQLWEKVYAPHIYKDTMSVYPVLLRPKSRGYVKLRSRNIDDPPIIDPKYLSHPDDIMTIVEGEEKLTFFFVQASRNCTLVGF